MFPKKQFPNLTKLGKITTPYGGSTRNEKFHPGVDIANAKGTPIESPVDGKVVHAVGGKMQGDASYGNDVMIRDEQGNHHNLGHLDQTLVQPGQVIKRGTQIGTMGATGATYSPSGNDPTHLDYRIVSAFGKYKNPAPYLNKL
jgi:murein DD-endopeptidase MepM/ murein hydrolase activator NlpD